MVRGCPPEKNSIQYDRHDRTYQQSTAVGARATIVGHELPKRSDSSGRFVSSALILLALAEVHLAVNNPRYCEMGFVSMSGSTTHIGMIVWTCVFVSHLLSASDKPTRELFEWPLELYHLVVSCGNECGNIVSVANGGHLWVCRYSPDCPMTYSRYRAPRSIPMQLRTWRNFVASLSSVQHADHVSSGANRSFELKKNLHSCAAFEECTRVRGRYAEAPQHYYQSTWQN